MAKIYLSSTYDDLKEHRENVYRKLRKLHHDVISMEDYGATGQRPLDKCLADVASCDLYVGTFAWRYGYIPPGKDKAITELEFREAVRTKKPRLIFLLTDDAPWPRTLMDPDIQAIEALRTQLKEDYMVDFFHNPDDLANAVIVAVTLALNKPSSPDSSGSPHSPEAPEVPALDPAQLDYYRHLLGKLKAEVELVIRYLSLSWRVLLGVGAAGLVAGLVMGLVMGNYLLALGSAGVIACAFIPLHIMFSKRREMILVDGFEYALKKDEPPLDVLSAVKQYVER